MHFADGEMKAQKGNMTKFWLSSKARHLIINQRLEGNVCWQEYRERQGQNLPPLLLISSCAALSSSAYGRQNYLVDLVFQSLFDALKFKLR